MNRAIVTMGIIHLLSTSSAIAQDAWTVWHLDDAPAVWRISVAGADAEAPFPGGLAIGGQNIAILEVHPQGVVSAGVGLILGDGRDPSPLDTLDDRTFIAPFWAHLADRACARPDRDALQPTVRWRFDGAFKLG